jgi:pyrimidine-nucleoside phosphorylase
VKPGARRQKLYALRDVTATVDNLSLIAASIMSKKIAAGADAIVLDVKTGSGAFMKTAEEAMELARVMVDIGTRVGRHVAALITDMSRPLGFAVGNALEVAEAVRTLSGGPQGPYDVWRGTGRHDAVAGRAGGVKFLPGAAREARRAGLARKTRRQRGAAQGGDPAYIDDPGLWAPAPVHRNLLSPKDGYIAAVDAAAIGRASVLLGAGRLVKDGPIDHAAGIRLGCVPGDRIQKGEILATLYCGDGSPLDEASRVALDAFAVEEKPVLVSPLFYARVQAHRTVRLDNSGL